MSKYVCMPWKAIMYFMKRSHIYVCHKTKENNTIIIYVIKNKVIPLYMNFIKKQNHMYRTALRT